MYQLGKRNQLKVLRESSHGVYLDAGDGTGILLPKSELSEPVQLGQSLRVFIYLDSKDQEIATLKHPKAAVGQCARLRVKEVNNTGAFLDWGLSKDLMLPYAEQTQEPQAGQWVNVFVYLDNTGRIAASMRVDRYLETKPTDLQTGDLVELMPWRMTDLGMIVMVDHRYEGMIHSQDLTQKLRLGDRIPGYVKQIRPDGRISLMLQPPGYDRVNSLAYLILEELREQRGFCPLNDKSPPADINDRFGCSKKAFKMALGQLLKRDLIEQDEQGIHLLE